MNIKQYPLLQYIIKKFGKANNFDIIGHLSKLICITTFVTTDFVHEVNDEGPIFIKKVWDCSYIVIGALGGVGTH